MNWKLFNFAVFIGLTCVCSVNADPFTTALVVGSIASPLIGAAFNYFGSNADLKSAKEDRALQLRMFGQQQGLASREFNVNTRLSRQQMAENTRQFDVNTGLSREQMAESTRQFDVNTGMAKDAAEFNKKMSVADRQINAVNSLMSTLNSRPGIMSNLSEISRRRT